MGLEVYCDPCTVNSRKVLAALDYMGSDYEFKHIDYFAGGHKDAEYTKVNPMQTVPAAKDGDLVINESNAILMYAADLKGSDAYPKDLKQRADVNKWLLWESSVWFPSCYIYLIEYVVKPLLKSEADQAAIDKEAPRFNKLAGVLNEQLGKTKFLVNDSPTIADFAVAAPMHLHGAARLPLNNFPNLQRWIGEIEKIPAWQKTQGAVNKALLPGGKPSGSTVQAIFNYTKDVDKETELYFYDSEKANGIHEPGDDAKEMTVHDGWSKAADFTIDKNGFSLEDFDTDFNQWENDELVKEKFYPQVVEFLKEKVGAKRVLVFDHTIRTKANDQKKLTTETNTSQRAPVMLVHCDYTAESGPVRVQQLLPDEAADLLSRRVSFINVWKPVRNRVEERPLAMCDVTSTPPEDFFKLYLRYRERTGENYVMRHSPNHKWWYFPEMETNKVILLKTYESETDGRARFVGHTAFNDPTSKPDAPTRESVEIRTIAFF